MSARMPETPCVHHLLKARFGIAMRHCTVVELDSTTPAKFSRHLVIGLPHAAFVNNRHGVSCPCAHAHAHIHIDCLCMFVHPATVGVFVQQVVRDAGDALLVCKVCPSTTENCVLNQWHHRCACRTTKTRVFLVWTWACTPAIEHFVSTYRPRLAKKPSSSPPVRSPNACTMLQ